MITEQELEELINSRIESEQRPLETMAARVWLCDVQKNRACNKRGCIINGGPCLCTANLEYAYLDEKGRPVGVSDNLMDWAAKVAKI